MSDEQSLMVKVADLYYLRHFTQEAIAQRLRLSRPTVSRLLARARRNGIVRIEIAAPEETFSRMEGELEERFGVREAIVVRGGERPEAMRGTIARRAAACLERVLKARQRVGVSWGTTLRATIDALTPRRLGTTVVPLVGGVGSVAAEIHANDLARRLAEAHGGVHHLLHAPAIVAGPEVRTALLSDPRIARVLEAARHVDVALVGIGALVPSSTVVQSGYFSLRELAALRSMGAVGDVCTRPFSIDGAPVDAALDRRILAVEVADLKRIPTVIAVAGGADKSEALIGALRAGFVDILVTDHLAARGVLRAARIAEEASS
ncbi:MAG TPA: sugar-binding transcriptional regulator [bacterium]|nr:sugar-binding transcriptional regulator [bacterium]